MRATALLRLLIVVLVATAARAEAPAAFDAAAAFGSRESVFRLKLSPDGQSVAYLSPTTGQGSALYVLPLAEGSKPRIALTASGDPERIERCDWVSNDRLVCSVYMILREPQLLTLKYAQRLLAVDSNGANPKILSRPVNSHSRGVALSDTGIIDWLPDLDGSVLMERVHLPDDHVGSRIGSDEAGLGVDLVDTRTLASKTMDSANRKAAAYLSDGRGNVRIMELENTDADYDAGTRSVLYRQKGSRRWESLCTYDWAHSEGFRPLAVDSDLNVAYGLRKTDGRQMLYAKALDGTLTETPVFERGDVDVAGVVRMGRRNRVIGVSYATERGHVHFLDPAIEKLTTAISRALPSHPLLNIVDSSVDESKLLIFAESDADAGVYYLYDRTSHQLNTFLVVRNALEGVRLATVKPISYPAADGTAVPGYLTLPPGVDSAKGLPAIVLPHGGPGARDVWGFDWLSQFYAARGYAVLQPNFRGSTGYGDAWFQKNGFRSWRIAIGDVLDGGRWLVAQGADPSKLAVVGWSYGGYAALQSAVADASVFKAVVAIAPVTDLGELKEQYRRWSNFYLVSDFIGGGVEASEGSPARNAAKIKVPVLLFHGTFDINVDYTQSQLMDKSLTSAGVRHELVTFDKLDHYLEDSSARIQMLRKSDAFLREALKL